MIRSLAAALMLTLALPLAALAQTAPPAGPAAPAAAAPQPQAHHHRHHRHGYLAAVRSLSLTPDQKQQIHAFVHATWQKNHGADAPTRHANLLALKSQIAGVLTPDQQTQLQTAIAQQRARDAAR